MDRASALAAVIDAGALLRVIAFSLVTGVGVTAVFATAIQGATRFSDMRRAERPVAAAAFATLMVLALGLFAAAVVAGLVVMTTK